MFLDSKISDISSSLLFGQTGDLPPRIKDRDTLVGVLLVDALEALTHALARGHDRSDWLTGDQEKESNPLLQSVASKKPSLQWAFFVLRTIIPAAACTNTPVISKIVTTLLSCCLSNNSSLRFCVFDLLALCYHHTSPDGPTSLPEGLDTLVRHKKLLVELGDRVKAEVANNRRSLTKYTFSLFNLMRIWTRVTIPVANYTQRVILNDLGSTASVNPNQAIAAGAGLKITCVSSNTLIVSWLLSGELAKMDPNTLKLTVRALSNFKGFEYTAPVLENLGAFGLHKFDNLRPGTLFQVCVLKSSPTAPDFEVESVLASTEPEEIMRLDAENVPVNLKISNNGLTVR